MTKVKVDELRKAIFENKQKLIRGEFKDTSFFKKTRREIARLLSGNETVAKKTVVTEAAVVEAPKKTKNAKAKKEEQ